MSVKLKIGSVFSVVGFSVLTGGLYWGYSSFQFVKTAVDVTGSIVRNVQDVCTSESNGKRRSYTCYQPIVSYDYASKSYETSLSERSSDMYTIGEKVELKVDPKNPAEALSSTGLWMGPGILSFLGFVFGSVGGLLLRSHFRLKKKEGDLLLRGAQVKAVVIDIGVNRSITVNGSHPFFVRAQFNDPRTNAPIVAEATELWHDPVLSGDVAEDKTVDVLYDSQDPKRCMIVFGEHKKLKAA